MIWSPLVETCETFLAEHTGTLDVPTVGQLLRQLNPHLTALTLDKEDLPYGRYLLHRDSEDRFNIQLDIFSMDYTGAIHCHESWGMIWVLKGSLYVSDWDLQNDKAVMLTDGVFSAGSGNCFCPPVSDWHRVITPPTGPQPVSIHIYGEGFDLDQGIYLDAEMKPQHAMRSAFKDNQIFLPYLSYQAS